MAEHGLLFELSAAQLLPVLRRATGVTDLPDFELVSARELPSEKLGYCARIRIPTFRGRTRAGREWQLTLFAKRMHWTEFREARHFERLGRTGLPVARFYGCVPGSCGVEILFLEYLGRTGVDGAREDHLVQYVTLHARINALGVPEEYREEVTPLQADRLIEEWTAAIGEIHRCGLANRLGEALATFCRTHPLDELLARVPETAGDTARMPLALNHGESGFQNYGWRGDELVFFDLHKFGPAPRFRDIADTIFDLRKRGDAGMSWEQAAELYLREYRRAGGPAVEPATFLAETECLCRYNGFRLLAWLKDMALEGESQVDKGRDVHRAWLLDFLERILPQEYGAERQSGGRYR